MLSFQPRSVAPVKIAIAATVLIAVMSAPAMPAYAGDRPTRITIEDSNLGGDGPFTVRRGYHGGGVDRYVIHGDPCITLKSMILLNKPD